MVLNQEESLFPRMKIGNRCVRESSPEKKIGAFDNFWELNWELGYSDDGRLEKYEDDSNNIADLLPSDPFDMDIGATSQAINCRIEDFEWKALGFVTEDVEFNEPEDHLLAELNLVWKTDKASSGFAMGLEKGFLDDLFLHDNTMENVMGFSYEKHWNSDNEAIKDQSSTTDHGDRHADAGAPPDADAGAPPDAMFFALHYLGVKDLLSVERVCKSLRDAVQSDPCLWGNIHIDAPLSFKIDDPTLQQLTRRAQGRLHSLSLVQCLKITNVGLKDVLQSNPRLKELSVTGCVKLRIDDILSDLKGLKSNRFQGIKRLRVGGLHGLTIQHLKELRLLLGVDDKKQTGYKPRFYRADQLYLSLNDERAIDVEVCPRCGEVRQVFDCPTESCQAKQNATHLCRACISCIARCINCGRCLTNCDYVETFCLEFLCLDCCRDFFFYRGIIHQQARYHIYICG